MRASLARGMSAGPSSRSSGFSGAGRALLRGVERAVLTPVPRVALLGGEGIPLAGQRTVLTGQRSVLAGGRLVLAGQGVAVAEQRVAVGVGERIAISLGERGVLDRAGGAAAVPGALRAGVLRMRLARLAVHALLPVHALLAALAVAGGPGEVVLAAVGRVVRLVGRLDGTPVGGLVERRGGRRVMATVRLGPAPGGGLVETVVGGVGVQPVGLVEPGLDLAAVLDRKSVV